MSNSLSARLRRAEKVLKGLRQDVAQARQLQRCALKEADYYRQQGEVYARQLAGVETIVGGMWLDLINSGLSHRQVLRKARSLDAPDNSDTPAVPGGWR